MVSTSRSNAKKYPSEAAEQEQLVKWLNAKGVTFFAVPNGGFRTAQGAAALKRQGVMPGVPDILIIDHAAVMLDNQLQHFCGVALELKRQSERPKEEVTDHRDQPFKGATEEQKRWLNRFSERGWISFVAYGALDAVLKLVYCNVIPMNRLERGERVMLGLASADEALSVFGLEAEQSGDHASSAPADHKPDQEEVAQPQSLAALLAAPEALREDDPDTSA